MFMVRIQLRKRDQTSVRKLRARCCSSPLSDATQLNVAVVGKHLAADHASVALGLHVEVLVAGAARDGSHHLHPEVVGVGAEGV